MNWACLVTTVPERATKLLPKTLDSIKAAGFPEPRLSIDGAQHECVEYDDYKPTDSYRNPRLRPWGNWLLSAVELYIRNPNADRYVIFQDDVMMYRNLREYLEKAAFPERGYLNLHTSYENERIIRKKEVGWHLASVAKNANGFQTGRGALMLVFDNEGMVRLVTERHGYDRLKDDDRGWRLVDGAIVTAMNKCGYKEYVHNPSLTQHLGIRSTIIYKNSKGKDYRLSHPPARSWRGESFDALGLLK